jgi:PST family polysaccharide transporter
MGFVILAKGKQSIYFWSELAWTVVNVGLTWICVSSFGVNGAGIAFFGSYIFHGLLIYPLVRRLSGFSWSTENKRTSLLFLSVMAAVFCGYYVLPFALATSAGALAAALSGVYSIRVLVTLVALDQIPRPVGRLLVGLGFTPSGRR